MTTNGTFVAVGYNVDSSNIGFSTDGGENWTVASDTGGLFLDNGFYYASGIAYGYNSDGSGVFVAVGYNTDSSNIGFSLDDGKNWTAATDNAGLFINNGGYGVAYGITPDGSGVFVAVGSSSDDSKKLGYSLDGGKHWTAATDTGDLLSGGYGYAISYGYNRDGSGVFVAVGYNTDTSNVGYSLDGGKHWIVANDIGSLFAYGSYGIAYGITPDGSGVFVSVGYSGSDASNIALSTDGGVSWSIATDTGGLFINGGGYGVAYGYTPDGSGVFVALGLSGDNTINIGFSLDGGQHWTAASDTGGLFAEGGAISGKGFGIAYGYNSDGSGVFVAVGYSGSDASNIGYSFDGGVSWTVATNSAGLFIGGSGTAVAYSPAPTPTPITNAMILTFANISSTTIVLPLRQLAGQTLVPFTGTVQVDWGDGVTDNSLSHTYSSLSSNVTVSITLLTGTINGFGTVSWIGRSKITGITQWGAWPDLFFLNYLGRSALTYVPASVPSSVTDMSFMFSNASNFTSDLSQWLVGNVTNMSYMFSNANTFNADLSQWLVSNVTNMSLMFSNARIFNSDLSQWLVGNVTNMSRMFSGAINFTSDLSQWLVGNVTNMSNMFSSAINFTSDLSQWNVGNVTNMRAMFYGAGIFNSDLSLWLVGNVTDMSYMFSSAINFTSDLSEWDVSNVTDMEAMFYGASIFNSDLSQWDVRQVIDMSYMFQGASAFNQDLSQWDVGNVTNMSYMFQGASAFNQDISLWLVGNVTDMSYMFQGASAFNGDLSRWLVSNVSDMSYMFTGAGMNTLNYSVTLIGWSNLPNLQQNVYLDGPDTLYIAAQSAYNNLKDNKGWIFNSNI